MAKMSYVHTVEYCLALRRNEVVVHAGMGVNLETVLREEARHRMTDTV